MIEAFGVQWGTALQLLTTIFSGGLLAAVLTFMVRNRQISINAEEVLRTHFGAELARLKANAIESDGRHEECEKAKRQLRRELDLMHDEIRGLRDQIRTQASDRVIALERSGAEPSDHVADSAYRVKRIVEGK